MRQSEDEKKSVTYVPESYLDEVQQDDAAIAQATRVLI
jgi:hypothetical protein